MRQRRYFDLGARVACWFAMSLAVLGNRVAIAQTTYQIGFAPGTTCAEVQERGQREGMSGGLRAPAPPGMKVPDPAPKPPRPWGTVYLRRSDRPGSPNIIYSCDGKARVRSQVVEVRFDTREEAIGSYLKVASQLRAGLGTPCWDSDELNEQQREVLRKGEERVFDRYRQRLEWRSPAVRTEQSLIEPDSQRPALGWMLSILTIDARVFNDDMSVAERSLRAFGSCDPVVQLSSVTATDDARAVLTKWFTHVRELGYPATVDFLDAAEKKRFHDAVVELARSSRGKPAAAMLNGFAGDGLSTEQTIAAIERSTPDGWLRDMLQARFRSIDGLLRYDRMDILGTVVEGETTYVLARMEVKTSDGIVATSVQSFAFKRSGQRLAMLLPSELQTLELLVRTLTHALATAR